MTADITLDHTDFEILTILLHHGRESFKEIGRQVGLSAPAVTERIRKMEADGVIKNYTVTLDNEKTGYPISAIVSLTSTRHPLTKLLDDITQEPGVCLCCRLTGEADFLLLLKAGSIAKLDDALRSLSKFGKTRTNIILAQKQKQDLPT